MLCCISRITSADRQSFWPAKFCQLAYLKVCANVLPATSSEITSNQRCVLSFKNIKNDGKQNSRVLAKNTNFSHFQKFVPPKVGAGAV